MSLLLSGGTIALLAGVVGWLLWWRDRYIKSLQRQRDDAQAKAHELTLELAKCEASRDAWERSAKNHERALRGVRERRDAEIASAWELARRHGDDVLRRKLEALLGKARTPGG